MVSKLEEKTNQLVNAMKEMEHRLKQSEIHRNAAEETARKLGQIIADKDQKKNIFYYGRVWTHFMSQDYKFRSPSFAAARTMETLTFETFKVCGEGHEIQRD
ncbi:RUN and FYVE domain-containing protein 2 [Biomphalaria glabrata]|nr:RUN and FYVE domain-containing protein 2-like [Biomphalaria glabrata]